MPKADAGKAPSQADHGFAVNLFALDLATA